MGRTRTLALAALSAAGMVAAATPAGAAGQSCPAKPGNRCAIVYDTGQGWLLLDSSDPKLQNLRVDLTPDFRDPTRKSFQLVASGRCAGRVVWLEYLDDDASDRDSPAGKIQRTLFSVSFRGVFDPTAGFRSNMTPKFPC
jgi:hypothetical protein